MRLAHIRASGSQRSHAESLGVPLRTYQNYEHGEREPDLRIYLALRAEGWNINWLLTGEGPERIGAESTLQSGSQPARLDRETLARAEGILTLALDLARVQVGATARSGMLADIYEELLSHDQFEGDWVLEYSQFLRSKLQAIQDGTDAQSGQEAGATAGKGAQERD